jgi:hypothetical protein
MVQTVEEMVAEVAGAGARVRRLAAGMDEVPVFLRGSYAFLQGPNTVGDIVLNVPSESDFVGKRLFLCAAARTVTVGLDPPVSDYTYRVSEWSSTGDQPLVGLANAISGSVELKEPNGRMYQSAPMNAIAFFPQRRGMVQSLTSAMPVSAYLGGMRFKRGYWLKRGTALTVRFTPAYTPATSSTTKFEYRISAVFVGSKRVRAA